MGVRAEAEKRPRREGGKREARRTQEGGRGEVETPCFLRHFEIFFCSFKKIRIFAYVYGVWYTRG